MEWCAPCFVATRLCYAYLLEAKETRTCVCMVWLSWVISMVKPCWWQLQNLRKNPRFWPPWLSYKPMWIPQQGTEPLSRWWWNLPSTFKRLWQLWLISIPAMNPLASHHWRQPVEWQDVWRKPSKLCWKPGAIESSTAWYRCCSPASGNHLFQRTDIAFEDCAPFVGMAGWPKHSCSAHRGSCSKSTCGLGARTFKWDRKQPLGIDLMLGRDRSKLIVAISASKKTRLLF